MAVGTYTLPNYETSSSGTVYKSAIDNSIKAFAPFAGAFAVHEQSSADMTVRIDSGQLFISASLFLLGVQNILSGQILAPSANPRRDLIAIDMTTGSASVITGAEAASPVDPVITAGRFVVARVRTTVGMTQITNVVNIDDLRPMMNIPAGGTAVTSAQALAGTDATAFMTALQTRTHYLSRLAQVATKTTSYTLVASDNGFVLKFNTASASTLTLPTNAVTSLADFFQFSVAQVGSGKVVFEAQSADVLLSYNGADRTAGLYAIATVWRPGSGEWFVGGNITS